MNYFVADTHFGHTNILNFERKEGGRCFESVEERDELIIRNWNEVVTNRDSVYVLGDFSWMKAEPTLELLKRLHGKKHLIKGNHDYWCADQKCRSLLSSVSDYKVIHEDHETVVMMHYPIMFYQNQHRGAIQLYGHLHNSREEKIFREVRERVATEYNIPFRCCNVGVMLWDYRPVTLNDVRDRIKMS